jgi:hypothetical protein
MHIRKVIFAGLASLAAMVGAMPAQAEVLAFQAKLDGKHGAATGSTATGRARIMIDTKRQTLSVDLTLDGITNEALWDRLVAAPIGPIHIHKYETPAGGNSVLVLPLPYGPQYRATKRGLKVTFRDLDYAAAVKLVNSKLSFDEFVAAIRGGLIAVNIHTDKFNPGEISGLVTEG